MYTLSKLPSGVPVLTAPVEGTASVTVMVFAGAGSRYEKQNERGISHFLEHMFFKGGKKYKDTKEVSMAIDGVGGDFNAFTSKEYAGYYVKVSSDHVDIACDTISDMLLHAYFPQEEINKERGVILEEAKMYEDTPMYKASSDFEELLYGDHPLGWDTIGTEEVIKAVTQADFQKHKDALYTADNVVIAFGGNITPEKAHKLAEQYFGELKGRGKSSFPALTEYGSKRVWLRKKSTEQAHLVLGVPGLPAEHEDHFAQKLLAIALGGNMSSRMFIRIREARGMCYYIATETDNYLDAGAFTTRAGVDQSRLQEAVAAIRHEYVEMAEKGIDEDELQRAKEFLKGKVTLNLEDSEELAHFFGKQLLLHPSHIRDLQGYIAAVDAVTKEQVDMLAKRLLKPEEMRLVVISKETDEAAFEKILAGA